MASGVICQSCGVEAPCKYVEFHYNIGMLVARSHRYIKGNLCKRCIHKKFWEYTLKDITLGWWGYISMILTPIFLVNNIARYMSAITLSATPANAQRPQLTREAAQRLNSYRDELISRLTKKEPLLVVAESVGRLAGVTPAQVILYVRALSQPAPSAPAGPIRAAIPLTPPPAPLPLAPPAPLPAPAAKPNPDPADDLLDLL